MFSVGRVCVKIAGRDANKRCVVVEPVDSTYVIIDGQTRRKKCNVRHLEPLPQTLDIEQGADHSAVANAFSSLGIEIPEKKGKEKEKPERPVRQRAQAKNEKGKK